MKLRTIKESVVVILLIMINHLLKHGLVWSKVVEDKDWYWCGAYCDYLQKHDTCAWKYNCLETCLRGLTNGVYEWPCCSVCCGCTSCLQHCTHCRHNPLIETDAVCTDWDHRMRNNGMTERNRVYPDRPTSLVDNYNDKSDKYQTSRGGSAYGSGGGSKVAVAHQPAPQPNQSYYNTRQPSIITISDNYRTPSYYHSQSRSQSYQQHSNVRRKQNYRTEYKFRRVIPSF